MTNHRLSEFRYLIRSWDIGDDRFAEIVECGVSLLPNGPLQLAEKFEVPTGWVARWSAGAAKPHPRLQRLVVGYLRQKLLG